MTGSARNILWYLLILALDLATRLYPLSGLIRFHIASLRAGLTLMIYWAGRRG